MSKFQEVYESVIAEAKGETFTKKEVDQASNWSSNSVNDCNGMGTNKNEDDSTVIDFEMDKGKTFIKKKNGKFVVSGRATSYAGTYDTLKQAVNAACSMNMSKKAIDDGVDHEWMKRHKK